MPKSIYVPHLGHHVHFGRTRSKANSPHRAMSRYARADLPDAPATVDYSKPALSVLKNALGNTSYGNCVIAGGYHFKGVVTGGAGRLFTPTLAQILGDYSAIGGYKPGDPSTDNGCDLQTAMNYWLQKGFCNGTKLAGWLAVDATNRRQLQQALYLFENLYFGLELPAAWLAPFPSGDDFVWNVGAPDLENGHCVVGVGYNERGVKIDTWGLLGTITWDAIAKLAIAANGGEVYVLMTQEMISKATGKAPNGFDWATLAADGDALGGHIPIPSPPAPTPPPAPSPPPHPSPIITLAQAQSWAAQGLAQGWPKG